MSINSPAFDIDQIKPAIQKEAVSIEDLMAALKVEIYKYKLRIPPGYKLKINFKDYESGNEKTIEPENMSGYDHILKVYFFKQDGTPIRVWDNIGIIYLSINFDYKSVHTIPIKNHLYGASGHYIESSNFNYDFGKEINDKESLIRINKTDEEGSEKLVYELYISVKKAG